MRKIYSLMLIAAGLLIGTSLQAATHSVGNKGELDGAIMAVVANGAAEEGDVIDITANITLDATTNYCIFYGNANYGHTLTLNLNGHKISQPYNATQTPIFTLYNGQMVINGPGTIESASGKVIAMYGYDKNGIDNVHTQPANYNVLTINKDVTVQLAATKIPMTGTADSNDYAYIERVLYVDQTSSVPGADPSYSATSAARGVVINLNGCAILADPLNNGHRCIQLSGNLSDKEAADGDHVPEINAKDVMFTAGSGIFAKTPTEEEGATALYGGGVAKWTLTNCTVEGCIAIYAKAGKWNLNGCTVHSNYAGEYTAVKFDDAGTNGGLGCAFVLDNNANYGVLHSVTIENTSVVADAGIAINETITKGDKDNLQYLNVTSGTFVGKVKALETTDELKEKIKEGGQISGGEWRSDGEEQHMEDYNNENISSVYYFADGDGNGYQIIIPIGNEEWVSSLDADKYVMIDNGASIDAVNDVKVAFLLLRGNSTVTVKAGKVLDAGTLMVENGSQVIVEPSGRLVISGNQGAYTYNETSLLIQATAEKSGELLIDPLVKINTTPKATVEFVSGSYRNGPEDKVYQFFCPPMVDGKIKTIVAENGTVRTDFNVWRDTEWDNIGMLQGSTGLTMAKFNKAFGFYSMLSNNPSGDDNKMKYTMTGNLYGNTTPKLVILPGYTTMANGFSAEINLTAIIDYMTYVRDEGFNVDPVVYTCEAQTGSEGTILYWKPFNQVRGDGANIRSMYPFMLHTEHTKGIIMGANYKSLVWDPIMTPAATAPRRAMSNITKTSIRLNHNGYSDVTTIAEGNQFSAEKDFGADAVKYMNEGMNIYVMDEEAMDIFATDNLNNTFIGFTATTAGTYTLSFEKLQGETMTLVDLVNGNQIDMVEGATYDFEAEANEANDYRFQVIRHNTATNLQNAHVGANVMKTMQNGRLMIIKNGRCFDAMGVNVK